MTFNLKNTMLKAITLAGVLMVGSCESVQVSESMSVDDLTGEWTLTGVFLGDALDTPCASGTKPGRTMTINFSKDKIIGSGSASFSLSGQSAVNQFFAGYSMLGFDEKTSRGTLKISAVGGTKMAGPAELMDCENRYYALIESAESYEISKDGDKFTLRLGRLKEPNATPSRDGGTYLIFEK